jgi:hypothetical protein
VLSYSYVREMAVGSRDTGLAVRKEKETKILQRWSLLGAISATLGCGGGPSGPPGPEPAMTSRRTRCGQFNATV